MCTVDWYVINAEDGFSQSQSIGSFQSRRHFAIALLLHRCLFHSRRHSTEWCCCRHWCAAAPSGSYWRLKCVDEYRKILLQTALNAVSKSLLPSCEVQLGLLLLEPIEGATCVISSHPSTCIYMEALVAPPSANRSPALLDSMLVAVREFVFIYIFYALD